MHPNVAKCLLVSKVLVADGIVTENKRMFLDRMMTKFGLDDDQRHRVLALEGWDQAEPVVAELSADEKREFLATLVDASSADGRLSPLEMSTYVEGPCRGSAGSLTSLFCPRELSVMQRAVSP